MTDIGQLINIDNIKEKNVKFLFECEELDGLVIMDKAYVEELDEQ